MPCRHTSQRHPRPRICIAHGIRHPLKFINGRDISQAFAKFPCLLWAVPLGADCRRVLLRAAWPATLVGCGTGKEGRLLFTLTKSRDNSKRDACPGVGSFGQPLRRRAERIDGPASYQRTKGRFTCLRDTSVAMAFNYPLFSFWHSCWRPPRQLRKARRS